MDTTTWQESRTLGRHDGDIRSVAFSPNGKRLASAGGGHPREDEGELRVWDLDTGREVFGLRALPGIVHDVAFSPDGKHILSGSRKVSPTDETGQLKVWDANTGRELHNFPDVAGSVWSVSFSPDGRRIAAATGALIRGVDVKILDVNTCKTVLTLGGYGLATHVTFSANASQIAAATVVTGGKSVQCEVRIWDATSGRELLALRGHTGTILCAEFSPNGKQMVSASVDGTVKIWDTETGKELFSLSKQARGVAFSPDGKHLALAGGSVEIHDVAALSKLKSLK